MQNRFFNPHFKAGKNARTFLAITGVLLALAAYKIYSDVFAENVSLKYATNGKIYLKVHSGTDIVQLYNEIEHGYYLQNFESFKRLSKLVNLDKKLKAGRYLLKPGMSNYELLKVLVNGRQEPLNVVFKYAERVEDLSGFFANQLETDSTTLLNLIKDTDVITKLGFDSNTIISLFIPNTYNFYWNTSSYALLERMNKEYKAFWTADRLSKCISLGLTQQQVSTLASIVQKESNKGDEMPVIAGVYLNRLRKEMPLQADPTIIYAWHDNSIRRVTNIHTSIISPYNTYSNTGLPPGPICAPSIQAIDAVLNFKEHTFIYFCAKEDFSGYHSFATSFEQHQQNARRYQRALNAKNIQ
ncbi:MAG: aminodeoxychorismate lyase [Bacteroidetes bacterium B1(2017)]|nr:MAG: aminodeoxychorismate lyase [Bacteroidetes bacterium B1(2017)]